MTTLALSDGIQALLEPIDATAPAGEDLDPDLDPFLDLQMGLQAGAPEYELCADKAEHILKEHSKHIQVIAWLAFCWLILKGLQGFQDGLQLLLETLKQYGASVNPQQAKRRLRAIQFLQKDNVVHVVVKRMGSKDEAGVLPQIDTLLTAIEKEYTRHFEDQAPDFNKILQAIGAHAESGGENPPSVNGHGGEEAAPTASTEKTGQKTASGKRAKRDGAGAVATPEQPEPRQEATLKGSIIAGDGDSTKHPKASSDDKIPPEIEELVEDISQTSAAGKDIEKSDDQDDMVLYMSLESEMQKRSGNEYQICLNQCREILANRSKHLRVAAWLCIAWYRTDQLIGLRNGLLLLAQLLSKYREGVFPLSVSQRSKIIQRLNTEPRLQLLSKTAIGNEKAEFLVSGEAIKELREVPTPIQRKLHTFKGQTFAGQAEFLRKLAEELGEEAVQEHEKALVSRFMVDAPGRERIRFEINARALEALHSAGVPQLLLDSLTDLEGTQFDGWSSCLDALTIELGIDQATFYAPAFEAYLNKNVQDILDIEIAFQKFQSICTEVLGEDAPSLENLGEHIVHLADKACELQTEAVSEIEAKRKQQTQKTAKTESGKQSENDKRHSAEAAGGGTSSNRANAESEVETRADALPVSRLEIKWAEDAILVFKKALLFYFEENSARPNANEGQQPAGIPFDARIYGLSRIFRWGNLQDMPEDGIVEGPNENRQKYLKKPPESLGLEALIRLIELDFLKQNEFLYWLDCQQIVVKALEQLGEKGMDPAAEIKFHLARLLKRFPGLPFLTFRDKKTQFASPETQIWLEEELGGIMSEGNALEKILPPLMGEQYDAINQAYEQACDDLPERFDEHARAMQQAIDLEVRKKGRFLIRLNLANYYSLGKHLGIARAKFNQLIHEINDLNIAEWESALCVSVWQSAYVNNLKLLKGELSQGETTVIEAQQFELFEFIAQYDGVLAHKLIEYGQQ